MDRHHLSASKARKTLAEILSRVSARGDRIVLERHGKRVAAVVSFADLELLEALEDRYDVESSREALAESGRGIPWRKLKRRLGL